MLDGLPVLNFTLLAYFLPAIIVAVTFHEVAHGLVAKWLGDTTADRQGRLSLNPLRHVDTLGTILLPLGLWLMKAPFLFGYAKPVPVSYHQLRNPRTDMIWVALAGPLANFVLATMGAAAMGLVVWIAGHSSLLEEPSIAVPLLNFLFIFILINLTLGIFNLWPLPPLDGSRVLMGLLPQGPRAAYSRLEPWGIVILLVILLLPIRPYFDIFYWLLEVPRAWTVSWLRPLSGGVL